VNLRSGTKAKGSSNDRNNKNDAALTDIFVREQIYAYVTSYWFSAPKTAYLQTKPNSAVMNSGGHKAVELQIYEKLP
jgi:hypothetical protein